MPLGDEQPAPGGEQRRVEREPAHAGGRAAAGARAGHPQRRGAVGRRAEQDRVEALARDREPAPAREGGGVGTARVGEGALQVGAQRVDGEQVGRRPPCAPPSRSRSSVSRPSSTPDVQAQATNAGASAPSGSGNASRMSSRRRQAAAR